MKNEKRNEFLGLADYGTAQSPGHPTISAGKLQDVEAICDALWQEWIIRPFLR
jgi:hypothetical protein